MQPEMAPHQAKAGGGNGQSAADKGAAWLTPWLADIPGWADKASANCGLTAGAGASADQTTKEDLTITQDTAVPPASEKAIRCSGAKEAMPPKANAKAHAHTAWVRRKRRRAKGRSMGWGL